MKKIKNAIYKMMYNWYDNLVGICVDQIEICVCEGDEEGAVYWCSLCNKYIAKQDEYSSKLTTK